MSKLVEELREKVREASATNAWQVLASLPEAVALLAHIERLKAEQAIACTRCGGAGEEHVTVPRVLLETISRIFGGAWNEELVAGEWAIRANKTIAWLNRELAATQQADKGE